MFTKFSKRVVSSLALILAASMLFSDVVGAYAEELTGYETTTEIFEENEDLANELETYDAAFLAADAVGSDGIAYEGVNYISNKTFLSLEDDTKEVYLESCNELSELAALGFYPEEASFGVDEKGMLYSTITLSMNTLYELQALATGDLFADVSANGFLSDYDVSDNDVSENDEEFIDSSDVSENDPIEVIEEEPSADISANDADVSENNNESDDTKYVSENMELFADFFNEGEVIEMEDCDEFAPEANEYATLLSYKNQSNWFKNQLNSSAKSLYDKFKSSFVDQKKTVCEFTGYCGFSDLASALSALISTNTTKTSWFGNTVTRGMGYYYGTYYTRIGVPASNYYSNKLNKTATDTVKAIVSEAFKTASTKNDLVYAVIESIDLWLCKNNYYDNDDANGYVSQNSKRHYFCHSPYGCLTAGYGVCESYAKALTWCLDYAGITNMYAVSVDHAYVYVQMPNNKWYLIDSTWNDNGSGSNKQYLMSSNPTDTHHQSNGVMYSSSMTFKYPKLSENYTQTTLALNKTNLVLAKGKSATLSITNKAYYSKMSKKWSSADKSIATVSKGGKVTAKKPGKTTVTLDIKGKKLSSTVVVYNLKKLTFSNNKTTMSHTYVDADANITGSEAADTFTLAVNLDAPTGYTAQSLGKTVSVSSSNKKVATPTATLSGNTITLKVKPLKVGKSVITVKCGGKTAKLTYNVKLGIQTGWFDYSNIAAVNNKIYTGKAISPKVPKLKDVTKANATAKKATYKVTYKNNKNAGTATVTISGTKNYGGSIVKTFTIKPVNLNEEANKAKVKATVSDKSTYNGQINNPKVTVKFGKTKLKLNKDFTISPASVSNAGTYTISIAAKGNYTGTIVPKTNSYTINKVSAKKLSVSVTKSKTYTGSGIVPTVTVKSGKKKLPAGDYTVAIYKKLPDGTYSTTSATPVEVGTYKVVVTFKAANIDTSKVASVSKTFKITKPAKKKK